MRLLKVTAVFAALFASGLALAYATGFLGLFAAGYPRAVWPALGAFKAVQGADHSVRQAIPSAELDARTRDLFKTTGSRALLLSEGGSRRLEVYGDGLGPNTRFNSYSLVKSLVGALVLKAVSEKRIVSLEEPLGIYLPEFAGEDLRERPIRSFLEMRSGLDFEEDGSDKLDRAASFNPFGNLARLHKDGVRAIAGRLKIDSEAEGTFVYQNVNTAILGLLLAEVYGKSLETLLSQKIWRPSGAAEAFWMRHVEAEEVTAYCCLYATARDWLRVGRFLMKNGSASDPFLPEPLWQDFFGAALSLEDRSRGAYGLHIRHDVLDRKDEALQGRFSYMMGQGGQIVYMMPDRDVVAVRFGESHSLLHSTLYWAWDSSAARH